jgi:hypothetical protein
VLVSSVSVTVPASDTIVAVCVPARDTDVAVAVCEFTLVTTDLDCETGVTVIVQFDVLREAETLVRYVMVSLCGLTLPM